MGVSLGDKIPIVCQLEDGKTNRFVQATVRDNAGTVLATVGCSHVADGLYVNQLQTMPNVPFVTVQFKVFVDAGFTIEDPDYSQPMDFFDLDQFTNVLDRLTQIENNLDTSDGRAS